MPIFAHGDSKNKLLILFYESVCGIDILRDQLYRAMVENDCMSYFDFESAANELEEDGFIAAVPRVFGQSYRITVRGTETLGMFVESLPLSQRERLTAYANVHREPMRRETQFVTSMEELPGGAYKVHLRAQEETRVVLDIELPVASRAMAIRIRKNWDGASEGIYMYLLERLLRDAEPDAAESEEE